MATFEIIETFKTIETFKVIETMTKSGFFIKEIKEIGQPMLINIKGE